MLALLTLLTLADTPNVVLVLADDLGYGDVQPLNPKSSLPTPGFNRLAEEGLTFTDAHTSAAVCTPTRYALLCGRHCWRTRLKKGVLGGYSAPLIESDRETLPRLLGRAGYHTGVVGKWHLGLGWQTKAGTSELTDRERDNFSRPPARGTVDFSQPVTGGPLTAGFDECFLYPASLDMSPYVFLKNDRAVALPSETIKTSPFPAFYREGEIAPEFRIVDTLDRLTEQALAFISRGAERDQPFFLYFPMTAPHKPVIPHERFVGTSELGPYGDFVVQTDDVIRRLLDHLDALDLSAETLLIVTSDNGSFMRLTDETGHVEDPGQQAFRPDNHRPNGPWRGTKADIYEAGHRVPFFVRWTGELPGGRTIDAAICQTDVLATLAELTQTDFDRQSARDSFSMVGVAQGEASTRRPIVHQSADGTLAIRDRSLKLIVSSGSGGRERPKGTAWQRPYQLYDLAADPAETRNLADARSTEVERLERMLLEIADGDELR